jgi:hypothetical protein
MKYPRKLGLLIVATGMWLFTTPAQAIIDLDHWAPPGGGESAENELEFLNDTVLPAYNDANDPDLDLAVFGTENINVGGELLSITIDVSDYEYIKLKWDGRWQFYYVGDETGEIEFNSTVFNDNEQPQALSHYTFFTPREPGTSVPDHGSTAILLGAGLLGVAFASRRRGWHLV